MRYSYQRDIIYKSICSVKTHPVAEEVYTMVKPHIPKISMGTIYRNLTQLISNGMILELNIDGVSHYDGNINIHQHFLCNKCQTIFDCEIPVENMADNVVGLENFDVQGCQIIFSGHCQECNPN